MMNNEIERVGRECVLCSREYHGYGGNGINTCVYCHNTKVIPARMVEKGFSKEDIIKTVRMGREYQFKRGRKMNNT
jgi:hypothetical protein